MALWQDAVDRSRAAVAEALADGGLDRLGPAFTWPTAETPEPAAAPGRHDRGVRAARRPRRPDPRVGRRAGRGGPAEVKRVDRSHG